MSQDTLLTILQLIASGVGGGLLVKLADKLLPSSDSKLTDSASVRKELWDRLEQFEKRIDAVNDELDEWKTKYYQLLEEHHKLRAENHGIREENHKLKAKFTAVTLEIQMLQRQVTKLDPVTTPGPTDGMPGSGHQIEDEP